ncbi:uncharacterized protein METZ01_LOCUS225116, partial [marine metagenome]
LNYPLYNKELIRGLLYKSNKKMNLV